MLETQLANKTYSYAFYLTSLLVFLASLAFQNIYLIAIVAALLAAAALYFRSGHIINNFLLKKGRVIEVYNGYRIGENLASAVKRVGNSYFGVACALLESSSREQNGDALASLVYNTSFPFEFSLGLRSVDRDRMLDTLEEKRRLKEIEIGRSDQKKYEKISALRRELSVIESEVRSMRGQKMLALAIKLKAFSSAGDEFEASREACRNMEQLASAFSSSLGLEFEILRGEKLLAELSLQGACA